MPKTRRTTPKLRLAPDDRNVGSILKFCRVNERTRTELEVRDPGPDTLYSVIQAETLTVQENA